MLAFGKSAFYFNPFVGLWNLGVILLVIGRPHSFSSLSLSPPSLFLKKTNSFVHSRIHFNTDRSIAFEID